MGGEGRGGGADMMNIGEGRDPAGYTGYVNMLWSFSSQEGMDSYTTYCIS